jgi:hypothetical protein
MPKLVTCKTLDFAHVLLLANLRGRLSIGNLIELSLPYLAGKRKILIIILVLTSIHIISKFLLNEVIPQP